MPAKPEEFRELSGLFAQYGVDAFLEFTSSLVTILDKDGSFLSWNLSIGKAKTESARSQCMLQDFLSSAKPGSVR